MDFYSNEYDNKELLGAFNLEPSSPSMFPITDSQNFVNLIKRRRILKKQVSVLI